MPVFTRPEGHRCRQWSSKGLQEGYACLESARQRSALPSRLKGGAKWEDHMHVQATQSMSTVTTDSVLKATRMMHPCSPRGSA